jgi:hypothetical protein
VRLPLAALAVPLAALAALAGCGEADPGAADGDVGPDGGPVGQGSAPRGDLLINELAANGPDWIELANRGSATLDLTDWFVTDSPDRLDHYYRFPAGTTLAPGAYLIVLADEGAPGEGHHAPFKLGLADGAYLLDPDGITVDALLYLSVDDGRSLQRIPDLDGLFFHAPPTAGGPNP